MACHSRAVSRITVLFLLFFLMFISSASARGPIRASRSGLRFASVPAPAPLPAELRIASEPSLRSSAATDTFHLAWFGFNPGGGSDPQGWTSHDITVQDPYFHVAGPSELDGGNGGNLLPIDGTQSMWCGAAPSQADPFCGYATLPGYGNRWSQILLSRSIQCDSVRLSYRIRWDSEPGYDYTFLEHADPGGGSWTSVPVNGGAGNYDGQGFLLEAFAVGIPGDSTRLRFRFTSDGSWSDEDGLWPTDGAVILDSLHVECFQGGVLTATFFEDFEGETPGAQVTDDGMWTATTPTPFGDFAALYPGVTVLQEDECADLSVLLGSIWGFFDDPARTNYACHTPDPRPDQGAIRYGPVNGLYIDNEIWSPKIPITGAGDEFWLTFRVYRDLPLDALVFYTWAVRSFVTSCPGPWLDFDFIFYGGGRDWLNNASIISSLVEPGATDLQISLGVVDMCAVWCNVFGAGACHTHSPLFDAVHLERVNVTGPRLTVRHIDLFQDNFAGDGSLTGAARADAAIDVLPSSNGSIRPGDSVTVTIAGGSSSPLAADPSTGSGPAAYLFASVLPPNQPGKAGGNIEAPETRAGVGTRYPLVDSLTHGGTAWYRFRMDSVITNAGAAVADRYCIDLNDAVFTPGDTIRYVIGAADSNGAWSYFSRRLDGQGVNFVTGDLAEALSSPMEFTILPAGGWLRGGEILYVDDTDDRGGPAQLFFDTAFDGLSLRDKIDRYDVLGPSSAVGNSLASRVKSVQNQLITPYRVILWNSGNLAIGLLGDGGTPNGGASPEKSDDYALLFSFLNQHPNNPGLYLSGDYMGTDLAFLTGAAAINLKSTYMNFNVESFSHVTFGEPVTPLLDGVGPCLAGEQFYVYGGCPLINNFDLLQASGLSTAALQNSATGRVYMLSQETPNAQATTARVLLSGFSYHYIRDVAPGSGPFAARVVHLDDALTWLQTLVPTPTGIDPTPVLANYLGNNHPNPFNPTTTITYGIRERGPVSLVVYNVAGQRIRTLVRAVQSPRAEGFRVTWDGRNDAGEAVSSGVFFYRLSAPGFTRTRKMVLLK